MFPPSRREAFLTSFLLSHCGGGQDKPGCLGPSAKLPRHYFSPHPLEERHQQSSRHFTPGVSALPLSLRVAPGSLLEPGRVAASIPKYALGGPSLVFSGSKDGVFSCSFSDF